MISSDIHCIVMFKKEYKIELSIKIEFHFTHTLYEVQKKVK